LRGKAYETKGGKRSEWRKVNASKHLMVAGKNLCSAITMDGDTATLSEGLKNSLNIHSNFNSKTGDRIDLGTVVGWVGIDGSLHIDGVTPSSIDLLDGSTDVKKESTMTIVRTLARVSKVPGELDISNTESVLENPSEGTIGHILETFKVHPVDTLGDSTSPIVLVIHNRLASLDDIPDLLANLNELVNVNIFGKRLLGRKSNIALDSSVKRSGDCVRSLDRTDGGSGQSDGGGEEVILRDCTSQCDTSNGEQCNSSTHYV